MLKQAAVVMLRQCPEALARELSPWVFKSQPFQTPLIDLARTEEELWHALEPKSCRYEVRKAQKFDCRITLNENVETARVLLNESIRRLKYREELPRETWDSELPLHDIFLCYWQGTPVVTHVIFRNAPARARLLLSGTADREQENLSRVIGPTNRLLHWHELQHYRAQGWRQYDFGGCSLEKDSPHYAISQFKLSFGGQVVAEPSLWLAKSAALRATFRGLATGQSLVRKIPWPERWRELVRTRPGLARLFR